jgi:hypothetical protein
MLFDVSWQQIKHFLCEAVESYTRSLQWNFTYKSDI